eukprot:SAG31_NODE_3806_length_3866_cov_1.907619_3_plen_101_part_00
MAANSPQRAMVCAWLASHSDLDLAFFELDQNGDGFVSSFELGRGVKNATLCEAIIAMADTDHDGKIGLAEFLELGKVLQVKRRLTAHIAMIHDCVILERP